MSEPAEQDAASATPEGQLEALRELLVGPQRQQLQGLQQRLDSLTFSASEVGRVLPTAISGQSRDPRSPLTQALVPVVEGALYVSVQEDRERIANLLYPLMGPAIRKAIAEALTGLVQSLNQALEHSVSLRGVLWRIEAARTGVSFGEVLLRHNLLYRVEQVFLIHTQTGLPLQHVVAQEVVAQDSSLVSGMLTALQDFVRDSFASPQRDGIDMLKVGELNVWIEQGPHASLAAVIRGTAPESLRTELRTVLETVHVRHAQALTAFDGDDSALADSRPLLQSCMTAQYKPRSSRPSFMLILFFLVPLLGGGFFAWKWWHRAAQWDSYVSKLRAQHGIVLAAHGHRAGRYYAQGLRDPLAADPRTLLADSGIPPASVELSFEEYQAMFPEFMMVRVRAVLAPPPDISLALRDRVLVARGRAPHRWLTEARRLAPAIAGVSGYSDSEVTDIDRQTVAEERAAIEKFKLSFPPLGTRLPQSMDSALDKLAEHIRRLLASALVLDSLIQVHVIGQADVNGPGPLNLALSQQRAEMATAALRSRNIPHPILLPVGIGVPPNLHPGSPSLTGEGEAQTATDPGRLVWFRVELFSPELQRDLGR